MTTNKPTTKQELEEVKEELKSEIKLTRDEFNTQMVNLRNDIFDRLDDIAGQLEAMREDSTLKYHQDMEIKTKVDDHEERIKTLEDQKN